MDSKKRSVGASERDEFLRAAWRAMVAGQARIYAERLVFVDECSTNTSLAPLYAWSRRGERALCSLPRNWGANVTLLASMSVRGMGPCLAVDGPTTREVFETYLERLLAPSLRPEQVVVMDNLSSHKGGRVKELIEERGCELLYLPPYSPDLNPIEEAFAKLKALLRKAGARTREALIEAMGRALAAVTAQDACGFFEHRGYRAAAQLP
jgi:transposase